MDQVGHVQKLTGLPKVDDQGEGSPGTAPRQHPELFQVQGYQCGFRKAEQQDPALQASAGEFHSFKSYLIGIMFYCGELNMAVG